MAEKSKLDAALDELLAGKSPEEVVGPGGVLKQLTKALLERAMGASFPTTLAMRSTTGADGKRQQSQREEPEDGAGRLRRS